MNEPRYTVAPLPVGRAEGPPAPAPNRHERRRLAALARRGMRAAAGPAAGGRCPSPARYSCCVDCPSSTTDRKLAKNQDLWKRLDAARQRRRGQVRWLKGHGGHVLNERADELAREEIRRLREG